VFCFFLLFLLGCCGVGAGGGVMGAHSASKARMSHTTVAGSSHRSLASGIRSTMGYYIQVVFNCHYLEISNNLTQYFVHVQLGGSCRKFLGFLLTAAWAFRCNVKRCLLLVQESCGKSCVKYKLCVST